MTSKQKRKIAQQNGAKAAGSKSPEGIQKSSLNALRHGLFAQTLVLTNESQPQFNQMLQSYIDRFKPADEVEMNLVDEMVAARWRQQRTWMIQTATLELQMDKQEQQIEETMLMCTEPTRIGIAFTTMANDEKTLELLIRYETTFSRMHDRAMKALQRLQTERRQARESEPEPVVEPDVQPTVPTTSEPAQPEKQNLQNDAILPLAKPQIEPIPITDNLPGGPTLL
jgi:hypothetical protein